MRTYPTVALVRALSLRAPRTLSAALLAVSFVTLTPLVSAQSAPAIQSAALNPGAIDGTLHFEGRSAADVIVTLKETGKQAVTNRRGSYRIANVAPGTYTLEATAEGYQKLYITDVVVKPGSRLTLSQVEMRRLSDGVTELERYVVKAELSDVTELDPFEVSGHKVKPFTTANVDIPRAINDAQPYYIFDSTSIAQSGAINVEDFLKQRLTMNTIGLTSSQIVTNPLLGAGRNTSNSNSSSSVGNASSVDLRGLGTDSTLVLVNGRRMAGVVVNNMANQPDLNGIPLGAIDRIEVLPASASGIYGGSAVGGVLNVVLKNAYSGGEVRLTYDSPFDTDAPRETASLSYGTGLNGGKTRVLLTASWSKEKSLYLLDRQDLLQRGIDTIRSNYPAFFSTIPPFIGSLPNIVSFGSPLVLLDGTSLGATTTFVPAGTSPTTSAATLRAGLIANAGKQDFTLPPTAQDPSGLYRPLNLIPTVKSYRASLSQELWPNLTGSIEGMHSENKSFAPLPSAPFAFVEAGSPYNPFNSTVLISTPNALVIPANISSVADNISISLVADVPQDWTLQGDYSWSRSKTLIKSFSFPTLDGLSAQNLFVDQLAYPLDFSGRVKENTTSKMQSFLDDFAVRGSGPLSFVPWVEPTLTFGLQHRVQMTPENTTQSIGVGNPSKTKNFRREQQTDSGYGELLVPLVRSDSIPLVHQLELQLSGRTERYTVDGGTSGTSTNLSTGVTSFNGTTKNGQPYFTKVSYVSTNGTIGLKYQPIPQLTLRGSVASAFLPPNPGYLVKNPLPNPSLSTVIDPKNGNLSYAVQTISGGNPDLKPQSSRSYNAGIIWQPTASWLKGLRANVEYYRIDQRNAFGSMSAQQFVIEEAQYPNRITRNSSGLITLVDTSFINLFEKTTEGWDFTLGYDRKTAIGSFNFNAVHSVVRSLKTQLSLTLPSLDYAGYPAEGGAPKEKTTLSLNWNRGAWTAGWSGRIVSEYYQYGAPGGPLHTQRSPVYSAATYRSLYGKYAIAQGSDIVPSQNYHDVFVGYRFGPATGQNAPVGDRLLANLTLQVGVKNVLDQAPPFDAYYSLYLSPYGDTRLRSFWISLKKEF